MGGGGGGGRFMGDGESVGSLSGVGYCQRYYSKGIAKCSVSGYYG